METNSLLNAMKFEDTRTENNCITNSTSLSDCVDLFFIIGSMRSSLKNDSKMEQLGFIWDRAFIESPLTAMKILFWARDIRGGAGERDIFRFLIKRMTHIHWQVVLKNLENIVEFGRWDDLFCLFDTCIESFVKDLICKTLTDNSSTQKGLAAKWMPMLSGTNKEKRLIANKLRMSLGMNVSEYRKFIVNLRKVVETKMSKKDWQNINYEHVPSVAMSRYTNAFKRHDKERYEQYLKDVTVGKAKIKTSALYPYDVIKNLQMQNVETANLQWDNLPNYLEGNSDKILCMIDVSGSMETVVTGSVTAKDIAISLGLYLSERMEGSFKDHFITFTDIPRLQKVTGSLYDRYLQIKRTEGYNTNLQAAFKMLLKAAVKNSVCKEDMPKFILILSDMEFDNSCIKGTEVSAFKMTEELYETAGYLRPNIIFWKLDTKNIDNIPVTFNEQGTALISGFSPSILKSVLSGEITPENIMLQTINQKRYDQVTV